MKLQKNNFKTKNNKKYTNYVNSVKLCKFIKKLCKNIMKLCKNTGITCKNTAVVML